MSGLDIISILIGTIFVMTGLAVVLTNPSLEPKAFWVVRVIVALGAAFAASGVYGTIEVTLPVLNGFVRATGPISMFIIVYLLDTPEVLNSFCRSTSRAEQQLR